jgi:hypothetical protein
MKKGLLFLAWLLILSACSIYKEPEFKELSGYKLTKIVGNEIRFNVEGIVSNPNWYALKMKKSSLDIFIENKKLGVLVLEEKLKIKSKRDNNISVPITLIMEPGSMVKMMGWALRDSISIEIKGPLKAGVFFIYHKFPVQFTQSISSKNIIKNLFKSP